MLLVEERNMMCTLLERFHGKHYNLYV